MARLFAAALTAAAGLSFSAFAAPADDLETLFDEYWASEMEESPFSATGSGVSDYNHLVNKIAPDDHARRTSIAQDFLDRLDAIDLTEVEESQRLSGEILRFILKHEIALAPYNAWRIPFVADSGFHMTMQFVTRSTPFRTVKDYEDYLKRLNALPLYLDQQIENMRQGLADGFTQPRAIMADILPSFEAQAAFEGEEHPLYAPFKSMPAAVPARRQEALRREARAVIAQSVVPAYRRVAAFMKDEYAPQARETVGALDLPDGEAYYAALVRYFTTRDNATADDIHELGLKEVARIRKEMAEVIAQTGFEGSFDEFIEFLRTDEQFYAKTPEELLKEAAWLSKSIDGKLPGYFGKLPRQPYSVEPVPEAIAPNYTSGRYSGAPLDAPRGGQYWVNTYALDKRPLYELPALTLHEAVPGHHLQIALAYEIENAPEFRENFYPHAFGEGWALYAEKLGVEMGVYETPYDHFGRLSMEMWRAARLVIDTGLHAKGWSRQQALDYLAGNTALSLHNVRTEIDRYIAWPGQALAYKMGELTILDLRAKAEKTLGDKFDLRAFHDAVLTEGGLPLDILAERVDAYIESVASE